MEEQTLNKRRASQRCRAVFPRRSRVRLRCVNSRAQSLLPFGPPRASSCRPAPAGLNPEQEPGSRGGAARRGLCCGRKPFSASFLRGPWPVGRGGRAPSPLPLSGGPLRAACCSAPGLTPHLLPWELLLPREPGTGPAAVLRVLWRPLKAPTEDVKLRKAFVVWHKFNVPALCSWQGLFEWHMVSTKVSSWDY